MDNELSKIQQPVSRWVITKSNIGAVVAFFFGTVCWALFQVGMYFKSPIVGDIISVLIMAGLLIPAALSVVCVIMSQLKLSKKLAEKAIMFAAIPPSVAIILGVIVQIL